MKNLVREPGVENRWGAPDPSLTLRMTQKGAQDDTLTLRMTGGSQGGIAPYKAVHQNSRAIRNVMNAAIQATNIV